MRPVLAAVALAALAALPAAAQNRGGGGLTLFEGPGYQGQSRNFTATVENLADHGFNDRSQSLRVQGRWRVCEDSRLRGRCVEVSGDIPNLSDLGLTGGSPRSSAWTAASAAADAAGSTTAATGVATSVAATAEAATSAGVATSAAAVAASRRARRSTAAPPASSRRRRRGRTATPTNSAAASASAASSTRTTVAANSATCSAAGSLLDLRPRACPEGASVRS